MLHKNIPGFGIAFSLILVFAAVTWEPRTPSQAADIQVAREQFRRYIAEWSEPEGFFDSDNFISNETSYLHVIDELEETVQPGGVYLGVGPDQNFSYIVHTRPVLAVIVDIRRQNMLQHLLFKAFFARASSRAEYLAWLFARETPEIDSDAPLRELLNAIRVAPSSESRFLENLEWVRQTLLEDYALDLNEEDLAKIEYVYRTFWSEGLDLRFSTLGRPGSSRYPTYEALLLQTDRQQQHRNFLSSEDLFLWLKEFQSENRLIPIVGNFGGPHAFKAVTDFLRQNGLIVSTFYTSNVEFYLFGRPAWQAYMENVRSLPVSESSIFIRAYFEYFGRRHPRNILGHRSTSLLQSIPAFIDDYDAGTISSYWHVVMPD